MLAADRSACEIAPSAPGENGYRTSWFGKNHNTPVYQTSAGGSVRPVADRHGVRVLLRFHGRRRRPVGAGQSLFRDTEHIDPPIGNPQWNLTTAMADDAIQWMNELNDVNPEMPFLLYYAPGGTHAPHHPTPEWIDKISDDASVR